MDQALHDQLLAKWQANELWPVTGEGATSISGGEVPNCFSNFCPEVAYDVFKLFASTVIRFYDEIDSDCRQRALTAEGSQPGARDWRWNFEHIEPMHYSECPVFSKILPKERTMPQVTIHGDVNGQLNIAGESVNSPVLQLTLGDLLSRIESADATPTERAAAKSKFQELLSHPVVAAIIGGLAGRVGA
ncbi:MAG: hypothetical protein L6Q75_07195 [Burkholderiaceae bacterium]|nr:hypothetical protein [Burkholderiaceae bacterium]